MTSGAGPRPPSQASTPASSLIIRTSQRRRPRRCRLAFEVPDAAPNSHTLIELLDHRDDPELGPIGRYRVSPTTGKTHQIRLHMNSLGIPIVHDPFYPEVLDQELDDFTRPLQLLARELRFTDPLDGNERVFTSERTLEAWQSS